MQKLVQEILHKLRAGADMYPAAYAAALARERAAFQVFITPGIPIALPCDASELRTWAYSSASNMSIAIAGNIQDAELRQRINSLPRQLIPKRDLTKDELPTLRLVGRNVDRGVLQSELGVSSGRVSRALDKLEGRKLVVRRRPLSAAGVRSNSPDPERIMVYLWRFAPDVVEEE